MKKVLPILTIATLLTVSSAKAAEWVPLGRAAKAELSYAAGQMHHHNGIATAWLRQDFTELQFDKNTGAKFDRSESRHVFDCHGGTSGVMQGVTFLKGRQVDLISLPYGMAKETLAPVPANSMIQTLMNTACSQPEAPFQRTYEPSPGS